MRTKDISTLIGLLVSWPLLAQPKQEIPTQEITTIVGEASGIGSRYWLNQTMAIEVRAEFGLFPVSAVVLSAAYHLSFAQLAHKEKRPVPLYVGAGVKLGGALNEEVFVFGFAAPIGIGLPLGESPFTAFVEVAPGGLLLEGSLLLDLDACLGIRYSLPSNSKSQDPTKKTK
jgi:hypothetical protein